ncbi:MAG TPA: serine hydrolase [Sphingomicrobium sp.]|jgi:CubicO group peptidase (beta-lactamase class C family)|nr:serine hydrolase [Sphingomicrobium sp.]
MKSRLSVALIALAAAWPALAAPPANFDQRVEELRRASETPGMAIAIVEDGKTVLAKGYGVRKIGGTEPVDADTIFMTGSTGKAVTVAALATLVDAGKLNWDDKVVDRLPGFQMYDSWVTREMTVRDLLVHRSGLGLGAGDLMFVPRSKRTRAQMLEGLKHIKPATSFRSGYAYDNILYTVAGALIEAVSGQSYESYVRDHVYKPAGLLTATSDEPGRLGTVNRAFPHGRINGPVRGLGDQQLLDETDQLGAASTPAGLLAMSANDLAKWLTIQLAHGKLPDGGRLFSEASSATMWDPQVIEPNSPPPPGFEATKSNFKTYALGWEVSDYAGAKIISHSGGVFGFITMVVLIPEKNVGFAITMNAEEGAVRRGLTYELIDHYLGRPYVDWAARYKQLLTTMLGNAKVAVEAKAASPAKVGPSLSLGRYAGQYKDPWYGRITVSQAKSGLAINFNETPRMSGPLVHYQYDTFIARFEDKGIEPAYVTFGLDAEGKVDHITMKPVSPMADFSFDYQDLNFTPLASAR